MATAASTIDYVRGDATVPLGKGVKVIAHVCNAPPRAEGARRCRKGEREEAPEERRGIGAPTVGTGPKRPGGERASNWGWGKGFVLAVSRRWAEPEAAYRRWHRERAGNDFGLGAVQLVRVAEYLWVANLVGQRGIRTGRSSGPPVRYEAIDTALTTLGGHALGLGASVHMPRIGCGLAGGRWESVEPLVRARLAERGVPVTVYDHD